MQTFMFRCRSCSAKMRIAGPLGSNTSCTICQSMLEKSAEAMEGSIKWTQWHCGLCSYSFSIESQKSPYKCPECKSLRIVKGENRGLSTNPEYEQSLEPRAHIDHESTQFREPRVRNTRIPVRSIDWFAIFLIPSTLAIIAAAYFHGWKGFIAAFILCAMIDMILDDSV